jgi:hypothetical protein
MRGATEYLLKALAFDALAAAAPEELSRSGMQTLPHAIACWRPNASG